MVSEKVDVSKKKQNISLAIQTEAYSGIKEILNFPRYCSLCFN